MCAAECIHNEYVSDGSQILAEVFNVLGLFLAETSVLQNDDLAVLHCVNSSSYGIIYYNIGRNEGNLCGNQLSQTGSSSLQGELCFRTILRLTEVRAEDYLAAFGNELFNSRESSLNPVVVCDHAILHRNIKVYSYQYLFALYINVVYRYFV